MLKALFLAAFAFAVLSYGGQLTATLYVFGITRIVPFWFQASVLAVATIGFFLRPAVTSAVVITVLVVLAVFAISHGYLVSAA